MEISLTLCLSFLSLIVIGNAQDDPAIDESNIVRPCSLDFDLDCIRQYFCENSQCDIALGPVPDPLDLKYYKLDIANSNITVDMNNVKVEGLNGKIIEFYKNLKTKKVVLALVVHNLRLYTSEVDVRYNQKAREPIERSGYVDYKYDTMTFTAVFPTECGLDLRTAEIYTYIDDTGPVFTISPSISSDLDCTSDQEFQQYLSNTPVSLQEVFVRQGRVFMGSYIQYNICNYGLDSSDLNSDH